MRTLCRLGALGSGQYEGDHQCASHLAGGTRQLSFSQTELWAILAAGSNVRHEE